MEESISNHDREEKEKNKIDLSEVEGKLILQNSPHFRTEIETFHIMFYVIIALMPITIYGVILGGLKAFTVIACCVTGSVAAEFAIQRIRKAPVSVGDLSAVLTGLLLALTLPPLLPWWIALIGGAVAVVLGKMVFGGIGHNIFNPALIGRAVLVVSWANYLTATYMKEAAISIARTDTHLAIQKAVSVVNGATPLAAMNYVYDPSSSPTGIIPEGIQSSNYYEPLLFANPWGCIGEASAVLLIIGGIFLITMGLIDWKIPFFFIGTVCALTAVAGRDPLFYVLSGGLLIGAFFMATDYTTTPLTAKGRIIFGVGCGLVTFLLRFWSNNVEGVMFSILFMNCMTPIIDRYIVPRRYGASKKGKLTNADESA